MRMPLAPATLRAGGWISAGMISVVQMPLPMRAAIDAERLAAALRAFAGIADHLDDVLGQPDSPFGSGVALGGRAVAGLQLACSFLALSLSSADA